MGVTWSRAEPIADSVIWPIFLAVGSAAAAVPLALRNRRGGFVEDEGHLLHVSRRFQLVGRKLVFRPDHQVRRLSALKGFDEDVVSMPLDLHRLAAGRDARDLLGQSDDADVIERGVDLGDAVGVNRLMHDVLSAGQDSAR